MTNTSSTASSAVEQETGILHNATDVAQMMLHVAAQKSIFLSNLQLQKLTYIAHGYMLGWRGRALYMDDTQAWKFGPVIQAIYHEYKHHGSSKIREFGPPSVHFSQDDMTVIRGVLDLYGEQEAMDLVDLTHRADTPWDEVWNKNGGKDRPFANIPNALIRDHFQKVVENPKSVKGL